MISEIDLSNGFISGSYINAASLSKNGREMTGRAASASEILAKGHSPLYNGYPQDLHAINGSHPGISSIP